MSAMKSVLCSALGSAMASSATRICSQGSFAVAAAAAAVATATTTANSELQQKIHPIVSYSAYHAGRTLPNPTSSSRALLELNSTRCKCTEPGFLTRGPDPNGICPSEHRRDKSEHFKWAHGREFSLSSALFSQRSVVNHYTDIFREILSSTATPSTLNRKFSELLPHLHNRGLPAGSIAASMVPVGNLSHPGHWKPWNLFNSPFSNSSSSLGNPSNSIHTWHFASPGAWGANGTKHVENHPQVQPSGISQKQPATVVLLGWLGSKQRHLRRYAEWYSQQGINAITFIIPMGDVLCLNPGGRAEEHVDSLVDELYKWLVNESPCTSSSDVNVDEFSGDRSLVFHTFSNTGWLVYGAVLKKLKKKKGGEELMKKIRGCVVDSAPVVKPDPKVWASGFSAALLKGRKKDTQNLSMLRMEIANSGGADMEGSIMASRPSDAFEPMLKTLLEKFFSVFLSIPTVKSRLSEVTDILANQQPLCPQLYIYSVTDEVIPVSYVESFITTQREKGRNVKTRCFENSPHVDHFRTFPEVYKSQLKSFIRECLPLPSYNGY